MDALFILELIRLLKDLGEQGMELYSVMEKALSEKRDLTIDEVKEGRQRVKDAIARAEARLDELDAQAAANEPDPPPEG